MSFELRIPITQQRADVGNYYDLSSTHQEMLRTLLFPHKTFQNVNNND